MVVIFGENDSDRSALGELFRAIRPEHSTVAIKKLRRPLVLLRNTNRPETRRKNAEEIAALIKIARRKVQVVAVIAHADCDATEPAHVREAERIESELKKAGITNAVAATPAWEIEAWWMLFPGALRAVRPCWETIDYGGREVGRLTNAKEELRGKLRPKRREKTGQCPDYSESDGIRIASEIRKQGLIDKEQGISASFAAFRKKIKELSLT